MHKVLPVHDRAVHPLPIKQMGQRMSHAHIIEWCPTHVDGKPLKPNRFLIVYLLFDDPVSIKPVPVSFLDPQSRGIHGIDIDEPLPKGLKGILTFRKKSERQGAKIADVLHGNPTTTPPVIPPVQLNVNPFLNLPQAIMPRDDGKRKINFIEILPPEHMLRQHRDSASRTQIAPVDFCCRKPHRTIVHHCGWIELLKGDLVNARQVLRGHQSIKCPTNIVRGDRTPITPACIRIQSKRERLFVL